MKKERFIMKTKKLTVSALMIALAQILSILAVFQAPNGGDITLGGSVPIIIVSLMYGTRWGIFTALVSTLVNMLLKGVITTLPTDLSTYFLMILLDYVLAFGVMGLAGFFFNKMGKGRFAIITSSAIVIFLRFVCHFASGIILWGSFAPKGQPVWLYSIIYNGGYMLPEMIITVIIMSVLSVKIIPKLIKEK
ncbi:MAG: energy-coupled thiamine transporter ThiT [Ruminococcaceae bacterium]|nr:energy-coupled thiamine transporter ThiT [Oscillospiraceae bacterium]